MESTSPFQEHLSTNYTPSDSDMSQLRGLVKDRADIAGQVAKQIEDVKVQLKALQKTYEGHLKYIGDHKALMSPIRRIPTDILLAIFHACVPQDLKDPLSIASSSYPAVMLSHVCHRWRDLAVKSPLLWNTFNIYIPSPPVGVIHFQGRSFDRQNRQVTPERLRRNADKLEDMARTWISRSGDSLIRMGVSTDTAPTRATPDASRRLETLIDIIAASSHRWRAFGLRFIIKPSTQPLLRLLELSPHSVPVLEYLYLGVEFQGSHLTQFPEIGLLKGQGLHKLVLAMDWSNVSLMPIEWNTLTELNMDDMPHDGLLFLLSQCHQLIRCTITLTLKNDNGTNAFPPPSSYTRIVLPHLASLSLHGFSPLNGTSSSLDLPSLRKLSYLPSLSRPLGVDHSTLVEWIDNFGGQLLDVEMTYVSVNQSALTHCLKKLPSVTRLKLIGLTQGHSVEQFDPLYARFLPQYVPPDPPAKLTSDVLASLTAEIDDDGNSLIKECYCPNLLQLECCFGPEESPHELMEPLRRLILSRRSMDRSKQPLSVARIEDVRVTFHWLDPPEGHVHVEMPQYTKSAGDTEFVFHVTYVR